MRVNGVVNFANAGVMKRACALGILAVTVTGVAFAAGGSDKDHVDKWITPTADELAMKSQPGYPDVPAIILYREEITKDDLHVVQHYERLKVLTEKGKEYANVELNYLSTQDDGSFGSFGDDKSVGDISGRTIHADGTVIPFTGKPYLKTIVKGDGFKYQSRVFTLPDVEVGSIIEYRYATRYNDNINESPDWIIQGDLFMRAAHYVWWPTGHEMQNEDGQLINSISWFPILPDGVTLGHRNQPGGGPNGSDQNIYEVTVKDVPPSPTAEYMPPIGSFTYRVMFNFTPYRSSEEYWKSEGKRWSKRADSFIGPSGELRSATQGIIAGANTPDEKLRKIYAKVMSMENTDYTRDHGQKEDKATGVVKVSNAGDVLKRGRGDSQELVYVFVGMARAAGLKAYAMLVPNRSSQVFTPVWMNFGQFSNTVAIVNIDGKDQFFAPGERYTPYGQLQWEYTYSRGLRQTDTGTEFALTPQMSYKDTRTARVANLTMAEDGSVTGTIDMTYQGAPALRWRQQALRGDEESLKKGLRTSLEEMLPKTLEVKVESIENLTDYEKPLLVKFEANGTVGTPTGKRLVVPVDLFTASDHATFPQEKRDLAVYFHYPETVADALRINLPATMSVEAVPTASKLSMPGLAAYAMDPTSAPSNVTVRRTFVFGGILVSAKDYPELRTYYSQFQAKDQESIVLKVGAVQKDAALTVEPTVVVEKDLKMAASTRPDLAVPNNSMLKGYSLGNGSGTGSGAETTAGPMRIGGSVRPPTVLYSVDPELSEEARKAKFAGNVQVYLWVDEQGNPSHIKVVRGAGMGLDEKAVAAVRQYKFKPAMQNGKPVTVDLYIDVNFQPGA
jgi:TonB family protein